jgi:hypothetical protein
MFLKKNSRSAGGRVYGIAGAEADELLLWYINKDKEAEDKELKAAQAIVNRLTGQDESSETDDEADETGTN